ncbi:MAG: OmpA family protein [Spirochaetes bacterium]|nr:OmpA family protein [Spirochaetota bacterium]
MHIKIFFMVLLLLAECVLVAEVHKTKGHNIRIYENDIKVLTQILRKNPADLVTLERLVKMCFAAEKFSAAVNYADAYLGISKSKEILFLKITALASQSDYTSAIKSVRTLLKDYNVSSSEEKLLNEKIKVYEKSHAAVSEPSGLKQVPWGKGKTAAGILQRRLILAGYDYNNEKPFYYDIRKAEFLPAFNHDMFSGLNFRNLYFFSVSPDEREILASVSGSKNAVFVLYKCFLPEINRWSAWKSISVLNKGTVNNFANFTSGGTYILFVSNRDSANGMDIYISEKRDGRWQKAVKVLGVNTELDESSLFLHPDNETVYFSSNGRGGSGGYDIYGAKILKQGNYFTFSGITNIREVNTFRNEIRPPLITVDLKNAFFNFLKTGQNYIYEGAIKFSPNSVSFADIFTLDKLTKKPLVSEVKLIESSAGMEICVKVTDTNGLAGFSVQRNKKYFVSFFSEGYIYGTADMEIQSEHLFIKKRYFLSKGRINKGYSFTADNIYFDTGSYVIGEESFPDLERVYDFLSKNPGLKVDISGNTDNVGGYEYNMQLSYQRANSIVEYLRKKGISGKRMNARGFGFLKNIAPNTSYTGRQKNRRVEIEVVSSD